LGLQCDAAISSKSLLVQPPIPGDYIRDLRAAKWGLGVGLHGGNPELLMSALGHSRPGPAGRRFSHVRYAPKATSPKCDRSRWANNRHVQCSKSGPLSITSSAMLVLKIGPFTTARLPAQTKQKMKK